MARTAENRRQVCEVAHQAAEQGLDIAYECDDVVSLKRVAIELAQVVHMLVQVVREDGAS